MTSEWKQIIIEFRKNKLAVVGFYIAVGLLLLSVLAPFLAPHDPLEPNLTAKLIPGFWAGNWNNFLGTDNLGRDLFSRILYGGTISLRVGYIVILITAVFGTILGVVPAYYGKAVDMFLMRIVDVFLAFPPLLLALAIAAALGTGLEKAMLAISLTYIPGMARIVRSSVLTVKTLPYVEASQSMGASSTWIIVRHILPNILAPAVVYLTLLLADAILYTAALGFLGVGIDPSTPEWGAMLSSGRDYLLMGQWWVTVFPGIMIVLAVLSFNLFGDGLRESLDSKLRVQ
ncbi:MAG: ABC transporter permease [Bacillota bacterium]|nr:ABC transporter permease [Bacillota bacterium]